jgi:linoleoyl-CoA desaturase
MLHQPVTYVASQAQPIAHAAPRIHFQPISANGFFTTLRRRVDDYFKQNNRHPGGGLYIALKAAFYFGCAALFYTLLLAGNFSASVSLALAVAYSISAIMLGINVGHDGAHNAVSRHPWINKAALNVSFTLIGVDPHLWQLRHAKSHHIFPNVNGCDIDIDSNLFLRLSPNHPRRWYQRYQHFYAPFLYTIVGFQSAFIQDFQYLFKKELANLTNITHPPKFYFWFAVRKIVYAAIMFAIPMIVLPFPWWYVVIGALIANAAGSFVFVAMLIGTHFADETEFPEPGPDGSLGHDFAVHALTTSLDWNPQSHVAQALAGGANAHAAHHLFPHMSHAHYVPVSRIIEQTAREFGVRYNRTTFLGLVASHFRFLHKMGTQ